MEPHSSVEASSKHTQTHHYFHHLLSGTIALLTLALPLYTTSHYSSGIVTHDTPALSAAAPALHPLRQGSEGAK